jgi:hypothetical protein
MTGRRPRSRRLLGRLLRMSHEHGAERATYGYGRERLAVTFEGKQECGNATSRNDQYTQSQILEVVSHSGPRGVWTRRSDPHQQAKGAIASRGDSGLCTRV